MRDQALVMRYHGVLPNDKRWSPPFLGELCRRTDPCMCTDPLTQAA